MGSKLKTCILLEEYFIGSSNQDDITESTLGTKELAKCNFRSISFQFFGGKSKARPEVDKAILLITDGKPVDVDFLEKVVRDLKDKQVKIVTVATGTRMSHIQKFRYIVRSIATGFEEGLRAVHDDMLKIVGNVAIQLCKTIQPPSPPKGKSQCKYKRWLAKARHFNTSQIIQGAKNVIQP